jgi:hypothetical protein
MDAHEALGGGVDVGREDLRGSPHDEIDVGSPFRFDNATLLMSSMLPGELAGPGEHVRASGYL